MSFNKICPRDLHKLEGTIVDRRQQPGFVVLSLLISLMGSWTTLELLNRRTHSRGWYNWLLLIGATLSMGGIGMWCMHFIGNRAIVLGDGEKQIQITYSAGFTAISFFLPVIVVLIAFVTVGNNKRSYTRLGCGGALVGLGVCAMNYVGQAGIYNYDCLYIIDYVIGAAVIAVVACTAGLWIFFLFRSAWSASWWKRGVCATILAGGASGMHWVASIGTLYRLKKGITVTDDLSRTAITISVMVLSIGGCFGLILFTLIAQAQKIRAANRARQIVLACAIFDKEGQICCTAEGFLPNQKITSSYLQQSVDDEFGINHPIFLWIYRTTRNWSGVSELIPAMKNHLYRSGLKNRFGAESNEQMVSGTGSPVKDYHLIFRELFCVAASKLAEDFRQPLDRLGILFDEIVRTGQTANHPPKKGNQSRSSSVDLERDGIDATKMGKGQLMFLVREVDQEEADLLLKSGYRFAQPRVVIPIVAAIWQITRQELTRQLETMRIFSTEDQILDPGLHLAFFAVKASMAVKFEILARKDARNCLPTMQLPYEKLEDWQIEFLKTMDNLTVIACMKHLQKAAFTAGLAAQEMAFASAMLYTLEALKEEIGDPVFNDAALIANPVSVPCRGRTPASPPGKAWLIAFRLIFPLGSRAPGEKLDFMPLTFFRMQQQVHKNSPDHTVFARNSYREFAPLLGLSPRPSVVEIEMHQSPKIEGKALGGVNKQTDYFGNFNAPPNRDEKRSSFRGRLFSQDKSRGRGGNNSSEQNLIDNYSADDQPLTPNPGHGVNAKNRYLAPTSPSPSGRKSEGGRSSEGVELSSTNTPPRKITISKASKELEATSFVDDLFKTCIMSR